MVLSVSGSTIEQKCNFESDPKRLQEQTISKGQISKL